MQCMNEHDKRLWEVVVAAERQVIEARAALFQKAESRTATLTTALRESDWDQRAALSLIDRLYDNEPELLDPLVEALLSTAGQQEIARIIASCVRREREAATPKLRNVIRAKLDGADAEDYITLAALLKYIGDNEMLAELVQRAKASSDPRIKEAGEDFSLE